MPRGLLAVLCLAVSVAACGQEKPPQAPAGGTPKGAAPAKPAPKPPPPVDIARAVEPGVDAKGGWEALAGLEPAPTPPCVLFELDGMLHCVSRDAVSVYDPAKNAWAKDVAKLPGALGMGAAATVDRTRGVAYLLQGGDRGFWVYDARARRVDALVRTPKAVGRGGSLALLDGRVYALRGAMSGEFYRYDLAKNAWEVLPNVGRRDEAKGLKDVKVVGVGFTTGFLVADKGYVYAWPDHHVQRFDVAANLWFERTWTSFGVRPSCDGGAFAWDPETSLLWAAQGMDSNALGVWDPPKQGPGFNLLRPRLPEPLHGEGSRAAIAQVDGKKHLFVYAPEPKNRLWRIPLERLERVRDGSRASDLGAPYESFHEDNGSSLVRRPGPSEIQGVFGALGEKFFFMRLEGLRTCDPVADKWTDYPGTPLGAQMTAGAFGVPVDGFVYFSTGAGDDANPKKPKPHVFARLDPATKTPATPLAPFPQRPGRGSRGARVGGGLWALRAGATRDVYRFDFARGAWEAGPPLPPEAAAPGAVGSGLVADGDVLYAFPDEQVWRLDTKNAAGGWTKFARLPWKVGVDGGMTALDDAGRAVYLVRGDVSRKLARLDLTTGAATALSPDLPDVVSVEGERAVVRDSAGKRSLFVMRGHDSHEIWRVALADLKPAP